MTLRKTVEMLRAGGMDITYRVRPDGGIVVTKIGTIKYSGRAGNEAVREIAGTPLAPELREQRTQISRTGVSSRIKGTRLPKLPPSVQKELRRVQKMFKGQQAPTGKPTTKNLRFHMMQGETEDQLLSHLSEAERYAKGLAIMNNLEQLLARAKLLYAKVDIKALGDGVEMLEIVIRSGAEKAYNEIVRDAHDYLYLCEEYANREIMPEAVAAALEFKECCRQMLPDNWKAYTERV